MGVSDFVEKTLLGIARNYYAEVRERFHEKGIEECYLAGGCFKQLRFIKDCDLDFFPSCEAKWPDFDGQYRSRNARTILFGSRMVQLCNYTHPSLKQLVESFDFNYCRAGVHIQRGEVKEVYVTEDYLLWLVSRKIAYFGSAYPLSSMIRLAKLYKSDLLTNTEYRTIFLDIVYDVAKRGFKDADDLRDQLEAIDLNHEVGMGHYRLVDVLKWGGG